MMKMTVTESKVKKWGNSLGIVVSREAVEEMRLREGQEVNVQIVKKQKPDGFGICEGAKPFQRDEKALDR